MVLALPHFYGVAMSVASSGLIAAIPRQAADMLAEGMGLAVYEPPVAVPAPEVRMYWHARHDDDPAHRWIRAEIERALESVREPIRTQKAGPKKGVRRGKK